LRNRDVYAALADPKRREILDLLRERGPLNAGGISRRFRGASRPGISRHLRILRESGLVKSAAIGRENIYALDPAPIVRARDGWLSAFGKHHMASLKALRARAERDKT
jgi:DNA-binding transcriptional ArsR family regulator